MGALMDSELQESIREIQPFEPISECGDQDVYEFLKFYLLSRHFEHIPKFRDLGQRVLSWLRRKDVKAHIQEGLRDNWADMRRCSGVFLLMEESKPNDFVFELLSDETELVRGAICEALFTFPEITTLDRLIEIAQKDHSYMVRGKAFLALAKHDPKFVLPVLTKGLSDTDYDNESMTGPPSEYAARALCIIEEKS